MEPPFPFKCESVKKNFLSFCYNVWDLQPEKPPCFQFNDCTEITTTTEFPSTTTEKIPVNFDYTWIIALVIGILASMTLFLFCHMSSSPMAKHLLLARVQHHPMV